MTLIYNATFDKNTRKLSFEDRAGNEIYSFIVPERGPAVDDITKPLTFRATQDGSTVKLNKYRNPSGDFQTSRDGGNTWSDYTIGSRIALNTGDEVSFRVKADRSPYQYTSDYFYFMMSGKIEAWHNVMSMYRKDDFATHDTAVSSLFAYLFKDCVSLTKAPVLPATILAQTCYYYMFSGCQSLTKAPELPATTIADGCYSFMFSGCQSLTKAPELPATTLANSCYNNMFYGCQSLKEVRIAATTTAENALKEWLSGVSATGDFYCDPNATIFPSGISGIPSGWRRIPPVDDIAKPLTLKATQDSSTVALYKHQYGNGDFQTSRDGGNTWEDYTIGNKITLNTGDEVSFRVKADRSPNQYYGYPCYFEMRGRIEAWHNVMSMYRKDDFATYDTAVGSVFSKLFQNCASLTKAPVLPATTLADYCYASMFSGCRSLTKAPELPATTLAQNCYIAMFNSCQSLKEVRISATSTAAGALDYWLSGVSATGDFYCNPNATIFPTDSASGIPANWTRRNIADYPN